MATPSIGHLGVFLNQYDYSISGHLAQPDIQYLAQMEQPVKPKDFGTLDLWAYRRIDNVPFMALAFRTGNVEMWDTDEYTFKIPVATDKAIKIVRDISGQAEVGYGGAPFELLVNKRIGVGARVKFDPMHPIELQVLENDKKVGDHWKTKFRLVQGPNQDEYVPKHLLTEGSILTVLAHTFNSEFGQEYTTWDLEGPGEKKFINKITNAPIQTSYRMTANAVRYSNGLPISADFFRKTKNRVIEYVAVKGSADNGIADFNTWVSQGGQISELSFRSLAYLYDDIAVGILAQEAYNIMTWGSGGSNLQDGFDSQVFAPGVYFQFDYSGWKNFYTIETFGEYVLVGAIKSYFKDKIAPVQLGGEPVYEIRVGDGAYELVTKVFGKYLFSSGVVIDAEKYGFLTGQAATGFTVNQPTVTGWRLPGVGVFKVVLDQSLNGARESNNIINPYVPGTGHRLSSYTILIQPYDTSSSNIRLVRPTHLGGGKVDMTIINGRGATHPFFEKNIGNKVVRQGSNLKTGFEAYFETIPDTAIVIDPTKVLKLVPKHPYIANFGF